MTNKNLFRKATRDYSKTIRNELTQLRKENIGSYTKTTKRLKKTYRGLKALGTLGASEVYRKYTLGSRTTKKRKIIK